MNRDSGSRPTGRDVKQARGEARQSGGKAASPKSCSTSPTQPTVGQGQDMPQDTGASVPDRALVSDGAQEVSTLTGFDPSRLVALAEQCEAATAPSRALDVAIFEEADDLADWCKGPQGWAAYLPIRANDPPSLQSIGAYLEAHAPKYTSSLDAAVQLVPYHHQFSLTDWSTNSRTARARVFAGGEFDFDWCYAKTPPLALCAASLRAGAASAIEAGTVETEGLDAKHESAIPKADAMTSRTNPMTTADAKVELVERLNALAAAVMVLDWKDTVPDDLQSEVRMLFNEALAGGSNMNGDGGPTLTPSHALDCVWAALRIAALEPPHSLTEAITDEMLDAAEAAYDREPSGTGAHRRALAAAYLAAVQAARPIDRQSAGASPMATGLSQAEPEVSALRASIPSAWQPIETAPKDGTELLAWVHTAAGGRVATVEWFGGQWVETYDLAGWMPEYGPTHWQPVPASPASGTEAGTGETVGLDPKGDGPVGATSAETPEPGPIAPVQDDDAEWLREFVAYCVNHEAAERINRIANRLGNQSVGGEGRG